MTHGSDCQVIRKTFSSRCCVYPAVVFLRHKFFTQILYDKRHELTVTLAQTQTQKQREWIALNVVGALTSMHTICLNVQV